MADQLPPLSQDSLTAEIRRRLNSIGDPCSVANGVPMGLDEMGIVEDVQADADGNVVIRLRLTSPTCMMIGYFKVQAEERVGQLPGVRTVSVLADQGLDWRPEMMSETAQQRRRDALRARGIPA
jgi:metal-sulfur cluster biosynthetic enzyme